MSSNSCEASQILDKLYEHVMKIKDSVPEDGHIELDSLENVELVTEFNFESLNDGVAPPLYFEPMQLTDLKKYPPDPFEVRSFFDISKKLSMYRLPISTSTRCRQISNLITDYATRKAMSHQHLQAVLEPDSTFYLEANLASPYGSRGWWNVCHVLEPEPVEGKNYPHLALHLLDGTEAHDNSILFSEFSALVVAMRGRARQPMIDSKSEREEMYDREEAGEKYEDILPQPCKAMFPEEKSFPVLLISCVLPQHARISTACLHRGKLLIRQSRLYSFEWRDKAPVDLFTRIFLSKPLDTEDETYP